LWRKALLRGIGLLRREALLRGVAALQRLLGVGTRRKVLLLLDALRHAVEHVLRDLVHLAHVSLLLHALLRV